MMVPVGTIDMIDISSILMALAKTNLTITVRLFTLA